MTISLDTNVVVRFFIDDDPAQNTAALACLERYDEIHVSDVALVETIYVLAYRYGLGRPATAKYIATLLNHPRIVCHKDLFERSLAYFVEHPKLSIEDCYCAVMAEAANAQPLLTFDKKLARQLPQAELLKTYN